MVLDVSTCLVLERAIFIVNIILSIIAILLRVLEVVYFKQQQSQKNILNPCLRTFTNLTVPITYIVPVSTIVGSTGFLIFTDSQTFIICRMIQAFGGSLMRSVLVVQCIDRIIATVFLENYRKLANKMTAVLIAVACILIISTDTYSLRSVVALVAHTLCAIAIIFLIRRNLVYHKILNSRYRLANRYQIIENIRTLRYIMPNIFVMAFIAALGPVVHKLFEILTARPYASSGGFYTFYILYFIINSSVSIYRGRKNNVIYFTDNTLGEKQQNFVISALGKKLPTDHSVETYFKQMDTMWK
ncbi:hypothetical protein FO519_007553 [Halicephalobus sp. NKZ332]|nr:hypothetical protein FO519_007553 [Halicephalobus sp. NKZ332]